MTPDEIHARVAAIDTTDAEAAHGAEDEIWRDVLVEIATGTPDPLGLASAALGTTELKFPRWCA